jgi:hypothetical protein
MHRLIRPALEGHPVGWFGPARKYLVDAWRDFIQRLKPVIARKNELEWRIELCSGGIIDFWTLEDPDAGRSRKYKRIAIDEAAKCRHLERAWNAALRPTLTDLKGDADFYSTPRGRDFFWRAFTWGEDPERADWACWRMPTAANPHIDPAEIEAARRQLPERLYRQEYLAEFLEDAGGVFRGVAASITRGHTGNRMVPDPTISYAMGIDLARTEDFTVITVVGSDLRQVYFERFNQISWERQISSIVAMARQFQPTVVVDSTGVGDPIYERLQRSGLYALPYQFTNASKQRLIDNLAMLLEQGRMRLMDIPQQEAELSAFAYELTPARNIKMGAPEGMHDDCVIALALAAWGASEAGNPVDSIGAF